jgi:hypothetical protein
MSSLAFHAAPVQETTHSSPSISSSTFEKDKKRILKNKTIKRKMPSNSILVQQPLQQTNMSANVPTEYPPQTAMMNDFNSLKQHIQQFKPMDDNGDSQTNSLANFNPLPKPVSMGAQRREMQEEDEQEEDDRDVEIEQFGNLQQNTQTTSNASTSYDVYNRVLPYYAQMNNPPVENSTQHELMKKLDYMIHLLEEQQEVKTHNVSEEVILYSFLGVFMIFVLDTFTKNVVYER